MSNDNNSGLNGSIMIEPGLNTVNLPGIPFVSAYNPGKYILGNPATLPGTILGTIIGSRFGAAGALAGGVVGRQINEFLNDKINGAASQLSQPIFPFNFNSPLQDALKHIGNARNHASPLAIDLDNDGIETTGVYDTNVMFDIKNTGFVNRVGWIKADDGILALDRDVKDQNGNIIAAKNGKIDNITELFGDYRQSAWDELKLLDTNNNNKIDAGDEQFNNLKVWRDLNQNGISEEGELQSLSTYNIKEISLVSTTLDQYQNENYISGKSEITYADNTTKQNIYDVHFLNDNANTWFKGAQSEQFENSFEVKIEALLLPLSRGYGNMPALHIAISKDDILLQMVTEFATLDSSRFGEIPNLLENILYRWAKVDDVDPDSVSEADGANIDARKLRFIEKFSGVEWEQLGNRYIVGHFASLDVKKAWDGIFSEMLNRFVVQGTLGDIFSDAQYDFATDKITLNSTYQDLIQKIEDLNIADTNFASQIAHILYLNQVELGVNFSQINADLKAIFKQDFGITDEVIKINWGTDLYYSDMEKGNFQITEDKGILKKVFTDNSETIKASNLGDYIFAKAGNDVVDGGSNEDYISGGAGNDNIYGNGDNDWLVGEDGDDHIYGGEGRDKITGGAGIDRLYGGDGDDTINGGDGADIMDGGAGSDSATYYDSAVGITVNLKTGTASGGDAAGDTFVNVENVHGSIHSDIITGDDQNNFLHGENGNDKIYGEGGIDHLFNGIGTSELYGGSGDDILDAYDGASDLLDGGDGIDTVRYNRPDIETRLIINLEQGKTTHVDRAGTTTYQTNNYYLVILDRDLFTYIDSNGQKGITYVLQADFLNMSSSFRVTNGNNFYMVQYQPVAIQTSRHIEANDILRSIENVEGGVYADNITGDSKDNLISGNGGADIINGGAGNDTLIGDIKNDIIKIDNYDNASESDQISGGLGNDIINGGLGNDIIFGNEGDDQLNGGVDNDQINGGAGNDIINGGSGNDNAIYGGRQIDYNVVEDQDGWIVTQKSGGVDGVDQLRKIEKIQFSDTTITINKLPTASLISAIINEDNQAIIDVLVSASDFDDDILTISAISNPVHGTATIVVNPQTGYQTISYIPSSNYNGTDSLDYTISDGNGGLVTKTLTLTINPTSDDPIAYKTQSATSENKAITIDVLMNAYDPDGGSISLQSVTNGHNGIAQIVNGKIIYTPNDNFSGSDTINYVVIDDNGGSASQALTITIDPINQVVGTQFSDDLRTSHIFSVNNSSGITTNKILGLEGDDMINSFGGNDYIDGGLGNDFIVVGSGTNKLIGGQGSDIFSFQISNSSADNSDNTIKDFEINNPLEKIDLRNFPNLKQLSDLNITQNGNDVIITLSQNNKITLSNINKDSLQEHNFIFQSNHIIGSEFDDEIYPGRTPYPAQEELVTIEGKNGDDKLFTPYNNQNQYILNGGEGNDELHSRDGELIGGSGNDRFVIDDFVNPYSTSSEQIVTINDLEFDNPNEKIVINSMNIHQFSDLVISQQGSDTKIKLGNGNNQILLKNTLASNLSTDNFEINFFNHDPNIGYSNQFEVIDSKIEGTQTGEIILSNYPYSEYVSQINGLGGNDTISSQGYEDNIYGGEGDDNLSLTNSGSNSNQQATHQKQAVHFYGQEGNDKFSSYNMSNFVSIMDGGEGDDNFIIYDGSATLIGGAGSDSFEIDRSANSVVIIEDFEINNLRELIDLTYDFKEINNLNDLHLEQSGSDTILNLPNNQKIILKNINKNDLTADNFKLVISNKDQSGEIDGTNKSEEIDGGAGDDIIDSKGGSDQINGGSGVDRFIIAKDSGAIDTIADFDTSNEKIIIKGFDNVRSFADLNIDYYADEYNYIPQYYAVIKLGNNQFLEIKNITEQNPLSYGNFIFEPINQDEDSHQIQNIITGTNSKDTLTGTNLNDQILGGANVDILYGALGNDTLLGGSSDDILIGGVGSDILDGGTATDTASYNDSNAAVLVNLELNTNILNSNQPNSTQSNPNFQTAKGGTAEGDILINIENITGSNFGDNLTGNHLNNVIDGGAGNDIINGGGGNDKLIGGAGADIIDGGDGIDTVHYTSSNGAVNINLELNTNILNSNQPNPNFQAAQGGTAEGDILINIENITGSDFGDNLTGDNNKNLIYGGAGNDNIFGQDGNDTLYGGAHNDIINGDNGNDRLIGDTGNDILIGGAGADVLTGGAGRDKFVFDFFSDSSATIDTNNINNTNNNTNTIVNNTNNTNNNIDTITDFRQGEDIINLHNLNLLTHNITFDDNPNDDQTVQGLSYYFDNDNNTIIRYQDNNQEQDLVIKLVGHINLGNGDFGF